VNGPAKGDSSRSVSFAPQFGQGGLCPGATRASNRAAHLGHLKS
jgi:hypothetical protein